MPGPFPEFVVDFLRKDQEVIADLNFVAVFQGRVSSYRTTGEQCTVATVQIAQRPFAMSDKYLAVISAADIVGNDNLVRRGTADSRNSIRVQTRYAQRLNLRAQNQIRSVVEFQFAGKLLKATRHSGSGMNSLSSGKVYSEWPTENVDIKRHW